MTIRHVLVKPASWRCDLACDYCFYKRAAQVYPEPGLRMTLETAQTMLGRVLCQGPGTYSFCWQGGEPTLMGLDFFQTVLRIQDRMAGPGQRVEHALQTNGLNLTADWARFLRRHKILVGLSLDGPREVHDRHRKTADGTGTWDRVMASARLLRDHGVLFNILTLLTPANVNDPEGLYDFFVEQGFGDLQFIPCFETGGPPEAGSPFSITGEELGAFYRRLFDRWIVEGFGRVRIRLFEDILRFLLDGAAASCGCQRRCDSYRVVEHNGDVYPCDFYVYPEWRLGNLARDSVADLERSVPARAFADRKSQLPGPCLPCLLHPFCQGDCPRYRSWNADEPTGPSAFCAAWKSLFDHLGRHPRNLTAMGRQARAEHQAYITRQAGRNDPCPCGSGRKVKKCCGREGSGGTF